MSNGKIDELKLMAYVDGELEAEDVRKVEALLETSEEARELVAKLQGSGDLLKETYAPVLSAPAPQHMVKAIKGKSARSNVVKLSRFSVPKSWMAMAASVALGVIVGVGGMQGYYSSSDEDMPAQEPSFKTRGGGDQIWERERKQVKDVEKLKLISGLTNSITLHVDEGVREFLKQEIGQLREHFYVDLQKALEGTEAGQEIEATLESGNMVIYTPHEITQSVTGSLCRAVTYKVRSPSSGDSDTARLTACRDEEGNWRAVKVEKSPEPPQ
jgi:surface antigen